MTHLCCHYFNRVSILYQLCPATKSECSTVSCPERRDPAWKVSYLVVGIYQSNRNHLTRRVTLPIPGSGLHYMLHTHMRSFLLNELFIYSCLLEESLLLTKVYLVVRQNVSWLIQSSVTTLNTWVPIFRSSQRCPLILRQVVNYTMMSSAWG